MQLCGYESYAGYAGYAVMQVMQVKHGLISYPFTDFFTFVFCVK